MALAKSSGSLLGALGSLKSLLPALGLAILVRGAVNASEALRAMEARVRRATEALGDYARVSREIYQISQDTGIALSETTNLFINLNRAAQDLGRSRGDVLQLTETIQQLGVISGASGEAMKNSLRQFSQAMAGGVVRAEEFNSIIENTPEIATAIAKGMGMTVGQLRLAVVEGKVLAGDVFDSVLSQTEATAAAAAKMPLTIGRAWTALKNSLSVFVASANEATGVTVAIANGIKAISDALDDMNRRISSGVFSAEIGLWLELFDDLGRGIDWVKGKFAEMVPETVFKWSDFFKDLPAVLHIAFVEIFAMVDTGVETIKLAWDRMPFLWDQVWAKIKRKAKEWWEEISAIFTGDQDYLNGRLKIIKFEYLSEIKEPAKELGKLRREYEAAVESSRVAAAAIREEQHARMDNRREMTQTAKEAADTIAAYERYEGALRDMITTGKRNEQSARDQGKAYQDLKTLMADQIIGGINEFQSAWESLYDTLDQRANASLSDMLGLWDRLREAIPGVGTAAETSIGKATDSIFDMDEALKQVQNNIQGGFSDLFYDVFQGKGIESVKDFAKRVKDIFLRLIADIAAAWAAQKIFKLPANFGFNLGSIFGGGPGGLINGGGIGGAIGQGTGIIGEISGGLKTVFSSADEMFTTLKGGVSKLFGGGTSTLAGNVGFKGPGAFAASSAGGSSQLLGLSGLAIPAAIFGGTLLGTSILGSRDAKEAAKYRDRMAANFGSVTPQGLGESGASFIGAFENGKGTVDEMYVAVSEQLNVALKETGMIVRSLKLGIDEAGEPVRRMVGDVDQVKAALERAKVTGFQFAGSLETAIEKGNGLRVSIEGDADVIKQKLEEAAAAGVGGFHNLEVTASGVSATLTGDIAQWNKTLQEFVNSALQAAVSGVGALGGAAASATGKFLALANAAAGLRAPGSGATINIPQHKTGLGYVPYDNYLALLHKGERVMTAQENRQFSGGGAGTAPVVSMEPLLAEQREMRSLMRTMASNTARAAEAAERSERRMIAAGWGGRK